MARTRGAAPARQQVRAPGLKLAVWLALCALPVAGATGLWREHAIVLAALVYLLMSLLALGLYGYDKRQATQGGWRLPENLLHGVELLGGWPGALLAQQLFRHKTRKVTFQIVFWLIVIAHQIFWADWVLLERHLSGFLLV